MLLDSNTLEMDAVMRSAARACVAARTAPKTRGLDDVRTCVVNANELEAVADEMERLAGVYSAPSFARDAKNVRASQAIVLIGSVQTQRGLNGSCGYCHYKDCAECAQNNGVCVYDSMDLGISIGSAVSILSEDRIDNRVMFSVGKAAISLGMMPADVNIAMGIPLSVSGKSPYFDRK